MEPTKENMDSSITEDVQGRDKEKVNEIVALLKKANEKPVVRNKTVGSKSQKGQVVEDIIEDTNKEFLLRVLSPQIEKNEEKKRVHKDWLMIVMGSFLVLQFLLVAIMISYFGYWMIELHKLEKPIKDSTIQMIFTFIGAYITSIIVELIAILKYIVKNVFDTSIAGMVKDVKKKQKKG